MISGFEQMMNEKEERAEKRGKQQGMKQGIQILIEYCRELVNTKKETVQVIAQKYSMELAEAGLLVEKYW